MGHVAPRWASFWARQEGHIVGNYQSIEIETKQQDYPKHYLFCGDCEQRLGVAENYLSRLTRGTQDDLARIGVTLTLGAQDVPRVTGVVGGLLMRGLSGIMLKMHLAPHQLVRRYSLSNGEVEELRKAIASDRYPEARFALWGEKLINRTIPDVNPRAVLILGFLRRDGGVVAHMLMAGMKWSLFLGPADRVRADFEMNSMPFIFTEGEAWPINPSEWCVDQAATGGRDVDFDHLVDGPPFHHTDPCPCGFAADFGDCCAGRWLPTNARRLVLDLSLAKNTDLPEQ
jgi:hypothetical protein